MINQWSTGQINVFLYFYMKTQITKHRDRSGFPTSLFLELYFVLPFHLFCYLSSMPRGWRTRKDVSLATSDIIQIRANLWIKRQLIRYDKRKPVSVTCSFIGMIPILQLKSKVN